MVIMRKSSVMDLLGSAGVLTVLAMKWMVLEWEENQIVQFQVR